ncbi:MAG: glycosyltransferase family 39 protein [Bacteroidales bacterium]
MDILKRKLNGSFYICVSLVIFTLFVYVSGLFPETTVDSAKYAAVSREIYESGDFIHLKIHGEPYNQKPPLLFWLGALFFKILGVSIFSFKLPNLIYSFLGIYSTYRLGQLIYDKRTGVISAILYMSCEAFFLFNMDVHTDMLLTTNIVFSIWQFAEYLDKRKTVNFILGFLGAGLAMMSKGVIGLAVPVISVGGYLIMKRDFRTLFSPKWLAGLPILLLVLYPTFKGLWDQFGTDGFKFYFWSNVVNRMRGDYSGGRHDYSFFFHTLIYIILPWSVYAYTAFVKDFRFWLKKGFSVSNYKSVYLYSVVIILGLIICVSSQQSPHYLLPAIPFIAIITGRFINELAFTEQYPKTYKWMLILRNIQISLLWPLVIIMPVYFFPTRSLLIWIPIIILLFLLVYSILKLKTKIQKLIIPLLISILAVSFVANTNYMPSALKYHGPIQASYHYNRIADDNSVLYTYDYGQFETYFYPRNVSLMVHDKEELEKVLSEKSSWFITSEAGLNDIRAFDEAIITEQYIFPYKKLTNISVRFLNPKTREGELQKIYLLKIR